VAEDAKKEKKLFEGRQADTVQRGVCANLANMRAKDIVIALSIAREHNPEVQKALDEISAVKR
jgi:uncharacterized protein (UPF0371 family)